MRHPYPRNLTPTKDGLPTEFYIETVLACNLKCPECAIGAGSILRPKKVMKLSDFNIIWDKIKGTAKLVYLHKWGEPMMNKNIEEMVRVVSESAHSHIMTNGILLNEKRISKLVHNGLGTLIFSIDGTTQGVYEKYRVGGQLDVVKRNLEIAHRLISENGNATDLLAQFIVFEHNEHQAQEFIKYCDDLGVRNYLRTAYVRFGHVKMPKNKMLRRKIFEDRESHLHQIANCPHADRILTITADGTLLLCSQDYNADFGLGNILLSPSSMEEMWFSDDYRSIRDSIKAKCPPELCISGCTIFPGEY